jgi:hypothetical protein
LKKIKVSLWDHHAVCLSVNPPYQLLNAWKKKNPPWLWSASELCRPSDRRFLAK